MIESPKKKKTKKGGSVITQRRKLYAEKGGKRVRERGPPCNLKRNGI